MLVHQLNKIIKLDKSELDDNYFKDELVSPLNILYDDLFSNAKFYN